MIKQEYKVIGVMSGTSLDGIDMAYITFNFSESIGFKIHRAETIAYSKDWQQRLQNLITLNTEELQQIDHLYTTHIAEALKSFIARNNIIEIDAICSHGHTALHRPETSMTLQIGNLPKLSQILNQKVVCDFRVQDVELGGQGAPLVPIGDRLLFSDYDYCVNLGGFANISSEENLVRIAYDICPVNIVLNYYAKQMGHEFDSEGKIATSGQVNNYLLQELNSLPFYSKTPPKSLGLEWVKKTVFPMIDAFDLSPADVISTFTEHIAVQISEVLEARSKVLFTGGGTYNTYVLERISSYKNFQIIKPENTIIDFKEALIFGLLGVLKLRGEANCLASVTGASHDHSSGKIFES